MSSFKQEHAQEKRAAEAKRIRSKYPDRIPVICEKSDRSDIPDVAQTTHPGPADRTVETLGPRGARYASRIARTPPASLALAT